MSDLTDIRLPAPPGKGKAPEDGSSLEEILAAQIGIAASIQSYLRGKIDSLPPKEYKDLAAAASSIIGMAHRTDQTLRQIESYKLFVHTVINFLRGRSDELGEDLIGALRESAKQLDAGSTVDEMVEQGSLNF